MGDVTKDVKLKECMFGGSWSLGALGQVWLMGC